MFHLRRVSFLFPLFVFFLVLPVPSSSFSAITQKNREDTYKQLEVFANVLSIIQENYVEEIDTHEAVEGAINGLLFALDPHSSYLKPENFEELQNDTLGSFTGIGIEITVKDGKLTVVSPIEGTPAAEAGIMVNDVIVKIEGEWTNDMSPMTAVKKLRGPKGSTVTISIHRTGMQELQKFTLTRDVIPIHSVKSSFLAPGLAYTRITNFQNKTTRDYQKALKELKDKEVITGLILDLRNNPGGLLNQAVKIADIFLDSGLIVYTKGRTEEQNMVFQAHDSGEANDFPLVVLVNEGSASASEIVAGALQDHKRGIILGSQTFGKGSVQTIVPLPEGAGLRLTTAHYFTPKGRSIQVKGIIPDVNVPLLPLPASPIAADTEFTREVDLKNHFLSPNDYGDDSESVIPEEKKPAHGEKQQNKTTRLARDNQLRTAFNILKSINLYSDFQNALPNGK